MTDIAISVENLSKQYRIGGPQARYETIRESLTEAVQAPLRRLSSVVHRQLSTVSNETIWALKDASFEACPELSRRVQCGEVVGIPSQQAQDKHWPQRGGENDGLPRQPFDGAQDKVQGSIPASLSRWRATPRLRRELSRTNHGGALLEVEEWCCKNDAGERGRT